MKPSRLTAMNTANWTSMASSITVLSQGTKRCVFRTLPSEGSRELWLRSSLRVWKSRCPESRLWGGLDNHQRCNRDSVETSTVSAGRGDRKWESSGGREVTGEQCQGGSARVLNDRRIEAARHPRQSAHPETYRPLEAAGRSNRHLECGGASLLSALRVAAKRKRIAGVVASLVGDADSFIDLKSRVDADTAPLKFHVPKLEAPGGSGDGHILHHHPSNWRLRHADKKGPVRGAVPASIGDEVADKDVRVLGRGLGDRLRRVGERRRDRRLWVVPSDVDDPTDVAHRDGVVAQVSENTAVGSVGFDAQPILRTIEADVLGGEVFDAPIELATH